ncbi:triacylglycerol lipase [Knoellia sinensis KCTC 19936]|uniref:Triacylglycerol lipase n=1 Tax=Knoellia sinensis KCTC 19936 TaxID=1385520 RepID=A0A0A0JBC3_9MICO|nr:SGNH/GDSL hydrolase family protein [Knoellia sinensis]KGN34084.1 triacylglycerol lipase [Knoellia sinensis KCTC 19936]
MSMPYVALGDSYAAGVGGGARRSECWRAVEGYPVLVGRRLGLDVAYQACLGATIGNVLRDQLAALGPETTHVSVTIGGNDIGFVPVLVECAKPSWMVDSDLAIGEALVILRTQLPARLEGMFARIRDGAPRARVVATAYPVLFNGEDCNALTFFSPHEMRRIEAGIGELAGVIEGAARAVGVEFVDPRSDFDGHAICDREEWLNGVAWPLEESYHPNLAGHAAYARLVAGALAAGMAGEVGPERSVRVVEGPARRGEAPTFRLPDLLSTQSLDGARRFGLNVEVLTRLVREERHDELHALDERVRELRGR